MGIKIGNKVSKYPIIQGGMGIGISMHRLAGAVAKEGGIGIISTANIGFREPDFEINPDLANLRSLEKEISAARSISPDGIIGANVMCVSKEYDDIIKACVANEVDLIISGAGLPLNLPALVKGSETKIAPIVSSARTLRIICKQWQKKYNYLPDLVVIEGPEAGGHLGFSYQQLKDKSCNLDDILAEVIQLVSGLEAEFGKKIPIIVAGGIYTAQDIDHFLANGATGVQMGTRFVVTEECDAPLQFKMAYINASEEDIVIIQSPVGMPGRAIKNSFIEAVDKYREKFCCTDCMKSCQINKAKYCISNALINSFHGNIRDGLIFCGSKVGQIKALTTVKKLMLELFGQAVQA